MDYALFSINEKAIAIVAMANGDAFVGSGCYNDDEFNSALKKEDGDGGDSGGSVF